MSNQQARGLLVPCYLPALLIDDGGRLLRRAGTAAERLPDGVLAAKMAQPFPSSLLPSPAKRCFQGGPSAGRLLDERARATMVARHRGDGRPDLRSV